jgi:zinc transport system ATP-binding protein
MLMKARAGADVPGQSTRPGPIRADASAPAACQGGATMTDTDISTTPVVRLTGGTAALGGRQVLRGVDLRVAPGEVVALLGANGSGKSTLVRTLVGLVPLTSGRIELFGTPYPKFRDWARIGYVPQRTTAAAGVPASVREVVASGRLTRRKMLRLGRTDRAEVDAALDAVGMLDRASDGIAALSGGQQQRVLIARALARRPDLLIMDEPMAGVDLASQEVLAHTLRGQQEQGRSVLLVLHELGPLESLIDRAVVLRDGCVCHDGPPPPAAGQHALPGHDHVHPHADDHHTSAHGRLLT